MSVVAPNAFEGIAIPIPEVEGHGRPKQRFGAFQARGPSGRVVASQSLVGRVVSRRRLPGDRQRKDESAGTARPRVRIMTLRLTSAGDASRGGAIRLIVGLRDEVEKASSGEEKKGLIERAGMELKDEELDQVVGGELIGWQFRNDGPNPTYYICSKCNGLIAWADREAHESTCSG